MSIDFAALEEKWTLCWDSKKIFNVKKEKGKEKVYVNVAYPYPSGAMHVGHCRTYYWKKQVNPAR